MKGRNRVAKFVRNPVGLIVYIKDRMHNEVIEILTDIKGTIYMGVRSKVISRVILIISFMCSLPWNLKCYNPSFTKEFKEDINSSRDRY
jgi:hypothetical protein